MKIWPLPENGQNVKMSLFIESLIAKKMFF